MPGKIRPRITTGLYKNQRLDVPHSARPITERVKLSVFDTIREIVEGSVCADLFAGSGNMGIEALSRGAKFAYFIDNNAFAKKDIEKNLQTLKVPRENYQVSRMDYIKFVNNKPEKVNIIFVDPPFDKFVTLKINKLFSLLKDFGVIVIKAPNRVRNKSLEELKASIVVDKNQGRNRIIILQKKS